MIRINHIKAFKDNYIWAIVALDSPHVAVVDPGEAGPVLEFLEANKLELNAILLTHHHKDHIGGVPELLKHHRVSVYGPDNPQIETVTLAVGEGDRIELAPQKLQLNVMAIPGHTLDHIAYFNHQFVFCGDTLFTGGCGKIFEGTPAQMLDSLVRLSSLDPLTQVYCGHEYTLSNMRFAKLVEPNNPNVTARLEQTEKLRAEDKPTVPVAMIVEQATNPFLRTHVPEVWNAVANHFQQRFTSQVDLFAALREWKNSL